MLFKNTIASPNQSLVSGFKEVDQHLTLNSKNRNISSIADRTYDGNLLRSYYYALTFDLPYINNAISELQNHTNDKIMNEKAMTYFLHSQSLLIEQLKTPYSEVMSLEQLNFDFQYHEDMQIQLAKKVNYLALAEFWKEYVCIYHQNSPKELIQIHEDYMRLLMMLVPKESRKNKHLKPFEWINNNCKWTVDKAALFLNPIQLGYVHYVENKGVIVSNPEIDEETPVDLEKDFYISKQNIKSDEEKKQNATVSDTGIGGGTTGLNAPVDGQQANAPVDGQQANAPVDGQQANAPVDGEQVNAPVGDQPDAAVDPNNVQNDGNHADPNNPNMQDNNIFGGGFNPIGQGSFFGRFFNRFWPQRSQNRTHESNIPNEGKPAKIRHMELAAEMSNDPLIYINIANEYIKGNEEIGLLPDIEKAKHYLHIAADLGSKQAMFNLGVFYQHSDPEKAKQILEKCVDLNYTMWYIGAASLYLNQTSSLYNITKALKYLEKALEYEDYSASAYLANVYLFNPEVQNKTKAIKYLDLATEKSGEPNVRLMLIEQYFQDPTLLNHFVNCLKIYKHMRELLEIKSLREPEKKDATNDMAEWYQLGYQKYTTGDFSAALRLFSWAAMGGHRKAMKATAYIWQHNLASEFTCQLGHPSLCAFIYHMQSFFFNNNQSGIEGATILWKLRTALDYDSQIITEDVLTQMKKLSLRIFDYLSPSYTEALFNKAEILSGESEEGKAEAIKIWDQIMTDSWNGIIDFRNYLPSFIAKYTI